MAKRDMHPYCIGFHPDFMLWADQQYKMFNVLKPHIEPQIAKLALPDLLLFAYLMGLNHAFEAAERSSQKGGGE